MEKQRDRVDWAVLRKDGDIAKVVIWNDFRRCECYRASAYQWAKRHGVKVKTWMEGDYLNIQLVGNVEKPIKRGRGYKYPELYELGPGDTYTIPHVKGLQNMSSSYRATNLLREKKGHLYTYWVMPSYLGTKVICTVKGGSPDDPLNPKAIEKCRTILAKQRKEVG